MPIIGEPVSITIQSILLATDFGPASEKATAYAKALAHRFGSTVTLTHVIDLSVTTYSDNTPIDWSINEMRRVSGENLGHLQRKLLGIETRVEKLEAFSPSSSILAVARSLDTDLIVMGTTSKHGLKKFVLGSTAESVIRGAGCPVLTVGPNAEAPSGDPLGFQNIIYATDFSPQAAKAAVYGLSFAQDSGANLILCHILEQKMGLEERSRQEKMFMTQLKQLIPESAYDWCNPKCVVEYGNTAETILALADKVNADLIVLGSRKSSFWLTYVEEGLTPALLTKAKCPVLTVC